MIESAIEAGLPLVSVTTTDLVNALPVLNHFSQEPFVKFSAASIAKNANLYHFGNITKPTEAALYKTLVAKGATLVLINPDTPVLSAFSAGTLPTPPELVLEVLEGILEDEDIDDITPSFNGLTLKDIGEVARLTMVRDNSLTSRGVEKTRRLYSPASKGLEQVDTTLGFYNPPTRLIEWCALDGKFFLASPIPALKPRGIMFYGDAGTGKTLGAKYLAGELGVPLYRLNVGDMMGKYVGESEGNMMSALSKVESEAPCVMLIDEVEKVFNSKDDNGVQFRLLSQILWWLQEHKSTVLTVMTTNDHGAIPPELYRAGRIDTKMEFGLLTGAGAEVFANSYIDSLDIQGISNSGNHSLSLNFMHTERYSPAEVTQRTIQYLKTLLLDKL